MEYLQSLYIITKPIISYASIKLSIISATYIGEWYSARLYSENCIGSGFSGFVDHFWKISSPSCSGLILTHISLQGVFITSCGMTFVTWIVYLFNISKKDYKKTENIIVENIEYKDKDD